MAGAGKVMVAWKVEPGASIYAKSRNFKRMKNLSARLPSHNVVPLVSPSVSVVMVSYRTGPELFEAIAAVLSQPALRDFILVDNGNPQEVVDQLTDISVEDGRFQLLTGHGNVGFARACNLGVSAAVGEFVLFLNPDCVLPAGGLLGMLSASRGLQSPWMMGGKLVNPDGTEQRGSRRETLTPWLALVEVFRIDKLAPEHPYFKRMHQHDLELPRHTAVVPAISGACMFMPKTDFQTLNGLDERYFLHVEDLDFCVRMNNIGGTVYFNPDVEVIHYRGTSKASPLWIEWHKTRGFLHYFGKNFVGIYPRPLIWMVDAGVLARFALRALTLGVGRSRRADNGPTQLDD